jgi:hypothetical protein
VTVSRQKVSQVQVHGRGPYRTRRVPTTTDARIDGLQAVALHQEQIHPGASEPNDGCKPVVSARQRARIERQTAVVHDASTSGVMRRWLAAQAAEAERVSIRDDLARAGLL